MEQAEKSTAKVSAKYNPQTKAWVVRYKRIEHRKLDNARTAENIYGYGKDLMDALDDVMTRVPAFKRILCRAILPSGAMPKIRLNF